MTPLFLLVLLLIIAVIAIVGMVIYRKGRKRPEVSGEEVPAVSSSLKRSTFVYGALSVFVVVVAGFSVTTDLHPEISTALM
ncbi:MAG: hypothetical protein VB032_05590 [Burkholderiaceae bacterium]|nr:hypothetical protein [Burkholderiaceae bacterium]